MKDKNSKLVAGLILILVLTLVFAAFDDITTGTESSLLGEYWVIGMSVVVLGGVLVWLKQSEAGPTKQVKTVKPKAKKSAKKKK